MDCAEVRKQMVALVSGELSLMEGEDVRRHLQQCRACETEWHRLARTWEIVSEWPDRDPRPGLSSQILSRISQESDLPTVAARALVPVVGMALFFFVVFTFLLPPPYVLDLCRQVLRSIGTDSGALNGLAFFSVGALYGGIPLLLSTQFFRRRVGRGPGSRGPLTALLFAVGAIPYVIFLCREFALGVTVTLTVGIMSGALGGVVGGLRLAHRHPIPAG